MCSISYQLHILFQIRIDRLVDKWSGSIEVGITAHNPAQLDFPATMTNMRSGKTGQGRCKNNASVVVNDLPKCVFMFVPILLIC